MMKRFLVPFLAFFLSSVCFSALKADEPVWAFGFLGGINFNSGDADYNPNDIPICPWFNFENQSGKGTVFGGIIENPLYGAFGLQWRFLYSELNTTFKTNSYVCNVFVDPENPNQNIIVGYDVLAEINVELNVISIEPLLFYNLGSTIRLSLGPVLEIPVNSGFRHEQWIAPEDNGLFHDSHSRYRLLEKKNKIPELNGIIWGACSGISLNLPVNDSGTVFFCPGMSYKLAFSDIDKEEIWNISSLRILATLRFAELKLW